MKKSLISLVGGIISGLIISYYTLEYNGWKYFYGDENGDPYLIINELDVDLLMNGLLIVIGMSALIYFIWTLAEKKFGKSN